MQTGKKLAEQFSTYYHSPIGALKITGNEHVISRVSFCDELPTEHADNTKLPPLLIQCTEQLIEYFNGQRRVFDLPLDQPGTVFQQEVWSSLMRIEFGKTVSYMQQAIYCGDPKAIRAVAAANGKNDVAIIVPCHRVIGTNRSLTGYAGGLWRKRWLLEHENKVANGVQTLF